MSLFKKFFDLIYPPRCPVCQKFLSEQDSEETEPSSPFCKDCFADFRMISSPLCPVCGKPFLTEQDEDHLCEECLRKRPYYKSLGAPYLYEGALMTAIHQFKYGSKRFLGKPLGTLLALFTWKWMEDAKDLLILPVPLNPKRLRERGFNQSLVLARHVGSKLNAELDFLSLRRVRYTRPQTGLGKDERRKNVRGAFELKNPQLVKGRRVLIIDDVATTGNTLNECARAVRKAGSKEVLCAVLARTGPY